MSTSNAPLLRCEGLGRTLSGEVPVTLVEGANVTIGRGEFVSITGPSGSGKSSLLYLLGLLDRPTAGRLWLDGAEVSELSDDEVARLRLERIGFVFQYHFLLPEFSVRENVLLPIQRRGVLERTAAAARAEMLLERLGLAEHGYKLPSQLSGGQRQRVAIARALANAPALILADEPTGNLDSVSSGTVQEILGSLAATGEHAVIVVTHDTGFAAKTKRSIQIVDGKIQSDRMQ